MNFFSATDSADEVSTRIFGVIGKLNQPGLHMSLRAGHSGQFIDLKLDDVFDISEFQEDDTDRYVVPESDYLKVTEKKIVTTYPTYYGATGYPKGPANVQKGVGTANTTGNYEYDYDNNYGYGSTYGHNSNRVGITGYKTGHGSYSYSLNGRTDYWTEADINATSVADVLRISGNLMRAKYMLDTEPGNETYISPDEDEVAALLLASRIAIDFHNDKTGYLSNTIPDSINVFFQVMKNLASEHVDKGKYASTALSVLESIRDSVTDEMIEELEEMSKEEYKAYRTVSNNQVNTVEENDVSLKK